MPKTTRTTRRSKVKELAKTEKELTKDQARKIRSGYVINLIDPLMTAIEV